MKQHKGKQELFTFSNSVAFNISIYRQTLYMYRLQRDLNERRIQKSLYNSLDKCLQVAELSSFTKKMPDGDYGESLGMRSPYNSCLFPTDRVEEKGVSGL